MQIEFILEKLHVYSYLPASGGPRENAIPWNIAQTPKELVRFEMPRRCTNTMGLRVTQ